MSCQGYKVVPQAGKFTQGPDEVVLGRDYNSKGRIYTITCDHTACDLNSSARYRVIKNYLIDRNLIVPTEFDSKVRVWTKVDNGKRVLFIRPYRVPVEDAETLIDEIRKEIISTTTTAAATADGTTPQSSTTPQ
jgi:hypothetical protein